MLFAARHLRGAVKFGGTVAVFLVEPDFVV
jgi:hypothetical protein